MRDWLELDAQWRQRSQQMFLRCAYEPDIIKAQIAWNAACQSEKRRLEWKNLCLQQEERSGVSLAADQERSLLIPFLLWTSEGR